MIEDASMTLVIMNLLDYVAIMYIGLVFVCRVVPLPVFLGRKWEMSRSSDRGVTETEQMRTETKLSSIAIKGIRLPSVSVI